MSINLVTASKAELKAYAKNDLDLSLPLTMNEDTMRDRIIARCKDLNIEVPQVKVAAKSGHKADKYVTINIAKTDRHDGSENAFVGVNSVGYSIPRGINVDVPDFVVEALKNAVQDIVTQDPESGELYSEPVLTYPYMIVAHAA